MTKHFNMKDPATAALVKHLREQELRRRASLPTDTLAAVLLRGYPVTFHELKLLYEHARRTGKPSAALIRSMQ